MKSFFKKTRIAACLLLPAVTALLAGGGEPQPSAPEADGGVDGPALRAWRSHMEPPTTQAHLVLDRPIQQLRSIRFATKALGTTGVSPVSVSDTGETPVLPATGETPVLPSAPRLSPETLEKFKKLAPGGMVRPIALADALFGGGNYADAYVCYELALRQEQDAGEKAWLLLQMANCRLADDPAAAGELYSRLVSQCPDSPWAKLAQSQGKLAELYRSHDFKTLLEGAGPTPTTARSTGFKPVPQPASQPASQPAPLGTTGVPPVSPQATGETPVLQRHD